MFSIFLAALSLAAVSGFGKPSAEKPAGPQVYGFLQAHARYAFETGSDGSVDDPNFRVQRVRLGVRGEVLPRVSYEIEVDPRAPQLQSVMRDAFIGLKLVPRHEIRLGQQKTQFGYENAVSSSKLFFVNRTEVSDNLSRGKNLRDIGAGIIGSIPLMKGLRLEDAFTVVNGAGMNVQDDDTRSKNLWGRLGARYKVKDAWVRLGFSGGKGDFMDVDTDSLGNPYDYLLTFKRLGTDLEADFPWAFLSAEFVMGTDDIDGEADELSGYYVALIGKTPWPAGPLARFDALGKDYQRWTLGAYYGKAKDRFRVLLNYELRQVMEDPSGNIGRGDDKLYLWSQVAF